MRLVCSDVRRREMQVVGKKCTRCDEKIFLQAEGVWCQSCEAAYHSACIDGGDCKVCGNSLQVAETMRAYSNRCPECGFHLPEPRDNCPKCTARTSWDDQVSFEANRAHVNRYGLQQIALGIIELATSFGALLFFFGVLSAVVSLYAIPDGVFRIVKGFRASQFN